MLLLLTGMETDLRLVKKARRDDDGREPGLAWHYIQPAKPIQNAFVERYQPAGSANANGPSRRPPVICPRSAILHSAVASMVDGMLTITVSTAERIATFGIPSPRPLGHKIGEDVHCSISDEKRLWVIGNVHDEDVADPPRGPQARIPLRHFGQKLVRM